MGEGSGEGLEEEEDGGWLHSEQRAMADVPHTGSNIKEPGRNPVLCLLHNRGCVLWPRPL